MKAVLTMLFPRWLSYSFRTAEPALVRTKPILSAKAEKPLLDSSGKKSKFEERNRANRDQLYEVIREVMTRSGVLSASYKFKVLSLDKHATSYLIMVDLSSDTTGSAFRPADTEAKIIQRAMRRYSIAVSAVYWRLHASSAICKIPDPSAGCIDDSDRLAQPEEFNAFQQAMLAAAAPVAPMGQQTDMKVVSKSRAPRHLHDFEDTEITSSISCPALSATQYGELH